MLIWALLLLNTVSHGVFVGERDIHSLSPPPRHFRVERPFQPVNDFRSLNWGNVEIAEFGADAYFVHCSPLVEPAPIRVTVDVIELNHVRGKGHKLDQFIFWDHVAKYKRNQGWFYESDVLAWVMAKSRARFDRRRELWIVHVHWKGRDYRVEAKTYLETTTDFDPELDERHKLPVSQRRGLR